jgi:hypothetical protein
MNSNRKVKICGLIGWSAFCFEAVADSSSVCADLLVQFVEPASQTQLASTSRSLTALIPCENSKDPTSQGGPTLIHFFEHSGSQLCIAQRSCGNIRAWSGYFGLQAGWSDLTYLGSFNTFRKFLRYDRDLNGSGGVAQFVLSGGQIERDCGPLSTTTCIDVLK